MRVSFWGVRGTFPATGADFVRYGGDTMCIEIEYGAERLIIDAGSGLRALGEKLAASPSPPRADIFLGHAHLDHIMGLSQFAPLWRKDAHVRFWTASREALDLAGPPFFPIDLSQMPATVEIHDIEPGVEIIVAPGVRVTPFALNHPGGAYGFKIQAGEKTACYLSDHEHGDEACDARVTTASRGADLLIYDATFTDSELANHRGWGHSTWRAGLALKESAAARRIAFVHHEPRRADIELDRLAAQAAAMGADALFAHQGLVIEL